MKKANLYTQGRESSDTQRPKYNLVKNVLSYTIVSLALLFASVNLYIKYNPNEFDKIKAMISNAIASVINTSLNEFDKLNAMISNAIASVINKNEKKISNFTVEYFGNLSRITTGEGRLYGPIDKFPSYVQIKDGCALFWNGDEYVHADKLPTELREYYLIWLESNFPTNWNDTGNVEFDLNTARKCLKYVAASNGNNE